MPSLAASGSHNEGNTNRRQLKGPPESDGEHFAQAARGASRRDQMSQGKWEMCIRADCSPPRKTNVKWGWK